MPERLPEINLLPKIKREKNTPFYLFIGLLIVIIISFAIIGVAYVTAKESVADTQGQLTAIEAEIEEISGELAVLQKEEKSQIGNAVIFAENYDIPTSVLIKELVGFLPQHSYLTEFIYQNREASVVLDFEALDIVSGYTTKLLQSPYLHDTKVDKIETFTPEPEEIAETDFTTIPRYKTTFSLQLHKENLKGAVSNE